MESSQVKIIYWIVIIVVIAVIFCIIMNSNFFKGQSKTSREGFNTSAPQFVQDRVYSEPQIIPAYTDNDGTLMDGYNFVPQKDIIPAWGDTYGVADTIDNNDLSDGLGGSYTLANNLCSKSCCSNQYSTPFNVPEDSFVCNNKNDFVPNDYVCNNSWQDAGCLCLTKDQYKFINSRGGNA